MSRVDEDDFTDGGRRTKSRVEDEGGFPTELFFEQGLPDVMICPICHEVMRKAVTLICGGSHKACETCSQKWVQEKNGRDVPCPCCKQVLPEPHFHRDPLFDSLIQRLPVRCPQRPCEWQGKLEDLTRHQTQECTEREVGCSHGGCTHRCPASALPGPSDDGCPAVEDPCPGCRQPFLRPSWPTGPSAPIDNSAPSRAVVRFQMAEHMTSAAAQHVTCLSQHAHELKRSLDALQATVAILQMSPPELFAHIRHLAPRIFDRTETIPGVQCTEFAFDLRALVPIRVVGLGLYANSGKIAVVSSRPEAVRAAPLVDEGWTWLGDSRLSPSPDDLVPVLFREPVSLAAGQSITLSCSNARDYERPVTGPRSPEIDVMPGVAWSRAPRVPEVSNMHFAGRIYYALQ
ncbi:hypothetical protein PAPYR_1639 [Paratrimastix pyriformis]|uniref:RING-type domain-containing protein n=1 Tax=Paratrimastix pyriformis TaxID=342808 RepID=A0ABQ8US41_9EUKA|nr:hypothetical protein PAPYR_1639 [Paratrimastix pyriformis]